MNEAAFRVGFVEGAMPDKWVRIWRQRRRDPIELTPVSRADQEAGIRSGSLDMTFVRLPIERDGLHCIPLYDEVAVAVAASDHYLAAADEVTHAEIADDEVDWSAISAKDAVGVVANGESVAVMPMSLARLHHRKDAIYRPVTDLPAHDRGARLAGGKRGPPGSGIHRDRARPDRAVHAYLSRPVTEKWRAGVPRGTQPQTARPPPRAR